MSENRPNIAPNFLQHEWRLMNKKKLAHNLLDAIIEDPEIEDTRDISINFEYNYEQNRDEIHIFGKVDTPEEKKRARQIVEVNTHNEVPVVNELETRND